MPNTKTILKGWHTYTIDILFSSNHNIHKSSCSLRYWASDPWLKIFIKIYRLKGLKPKNKDHMNFYECCDLTKKVYLIYMYLVHYIHKWKNFWHALPSSLRQFSSTYLPKTWRPEQKAKQTWSHWARIRKNFNLGNRIIID